MPKHCQKPRMLKLMSNASGGKSGKNPKVNSDRCSKRNKGSRTKEVHLDSIMYQVRYYQEAGVYLEHIPK